MLNNKDLIIKLYARLSEIEKELSEEYKDGETVWASNLECEYEEIENTIYRLESE